MTRKSVPFTTPYSVKHDTKFVWWATSGCPNERTSVGMSEKCHVWTAPAVQEEFDVSAKRSGAAMYPAFECSRYGRWP